MIKTRQYVIRTTVAGDTMYIADRIQKGGRQWTQFVDQARVFDSGDAARFYKKQKYVTSGRVVILVGGAS